MNIKQIVGKNLKNYRIQSGMTQKQVATALRKYQPDYCQYEKGIIELDYEKIIILCKMFDITPNELFEGCFDKDYNY